MHLPELGDDKELARKEAAFFLDFARRYRPEMRQMRKAGLLGIGSENFTRAARHQELSGVVSEELAELLDLSGNKLKKLVRYSLLHDNDKRKQVENQSRIVF